MVGDLLSCNRRRDDNISLTDTEPSDRLREPSMGDNGGDSDGGVEVSDGEEKNAGRLFIDDPS